MKNSRSYFSLPYANEADRRALLEELIVLNRRLGAVSNEALLNDERWSPEQRQMLQDLATP